MAVCFILRSDAEKCETLLDGLKRSANLGRDEYPDTLTQAFDLLARESGEYDSVHQSGNRYRGRGRRSGRGRQNCIFAQQGRGGQSNDGNNSNEYTYSRKNENGSDEVVAGVDGTTFEHITCFG